MGLSFIAAWGGRDLFARVGRRFTIVLAGAVVVALAVGTYRQTYQWRDGISLWSHAAEVTPGPGGAQAQFEWAKSLSEAAVTHFRLAIEAKPDWAGAHGLLGSRARSDGSKG